MLTAFRILIFIITLIGFLGTFGELDNTNRDVPRIFAAVTIAGMLSFCLTLLI